MHMDKLWTDIYMNKIIAPRNNRNFIKINNVTALQNAICTSGY